MWWLSGNNGKVVTMKTTQGFNDEWELLILKQLSVKGRLIGFSII